MQGKRLSLISLEIKKYSKQKSGKTSKEKRCLQITKAHLGLRSKLSFVYSVLSHKILQSVTTLRICISFPSSNVQKVQKELPFASIPLDNKRRTFYPTKKKYFRELVKSFTCITFLLQFCILLALLAAFQSTKVSKH